MLRLCCRGCGLSGVLRCPVTFLCACLQSLGGEVQTVETDGEYGRMSIRTTQASELYSDETDHAQMVWMSHGDKAVRLPDGFEAVATSEKVSSFAACLSCNPDAFRTNII